MPGLFGCHIKDDAARFDFSVETPIAAAELQEIERIANAYVLRGGQVVTYPHPSVRDARYWACEGRVIACGGTHIASTAPIGRIQVDRKNLGRGKDRLSCDFVESIPEAWA